jgi:NAD dependent epimerase/dehydratase family enzyme
MPKFIAKIIFGEMANELLLEGQKVVPQKILQSGYKFRYQNLKLAIENSLRKNR